MNVTMSPDTAGDQLLVPNIVRAIGQALIITPLSGHRDRRRSRRAKRPPPLVSPT